jgi:hypothetical protein
MFHVAATSFASPYRKGYVIPAGDIAYFMHEDDEGYDGDLSSKISERYLYDIFKPGITRTPCQQPGCSYHSNPTP